MTRTEWLFEFRSVFDETTAGFITDIEAYIYGNSGQNQVIDILIEKTLQHRKIEPFFEYEQLKTLITLKQFGTTSGTAFYSFTTMSITDYKLSYSVYVNLANTGYFMATEVSSSKEYWLSDNEFGIAQITKPRYFIEADVLYLKPSPTASVANGLNFRYYKRPTAFSSSQDFALPASTHESILYYALFLAFDKDKKKEMSDKYLKLFYESLPQ